MDAKPVCQRLIGWALTRNYLTANETWASKDDKGPEDRDVWYHYALLGNADKPDTVVRKRLDWNRGTSSRSFKEFFQGSNPAFDYGIMTHTSELKVFERQSQYKGKQKDFDIYRMLAVYAQKNLNLYKSDATTEAEAGLKTQKDYKNQ